MNMQQFLQSNVHNLSWRNEFATCQSNGGYRQLDLFITEATYETLEFDARVSIFDSGSLRVVDENKLATVRRSCFNDLLLHVYMGR